MLIRDVMGGESVGCCCWCFGSVAPFILAADVFPNYACGILFMFARSVYCFISVIQRTPRNSFFKLYYRFSRVFRSDSG